MPRVLIAPDSFKGTLTAREVCEITGRAFKDTIENCEITALPLADGGEGLCACLEKIRGGRFVTAQAPGVFGEPVLAQYLMLDNGTAVIETASVAGLPLAGDRKNPETATTLGLGTLILHAEKSGAKRILLGLGGSATNDCGAGMASALGYEFYSGSGRIECPSGKDLGNITHIKPPAEKVKIPVTCACDVDNPLYGENGAAYVFAPQKGADDEMVKRLDGGLRNMSGVIKKDLGADVADMPGAGAAGGLGAGAVVFLGAELQRGIDLMLDYGGFAAEAAKADLVITGEGRLDSQSMQGKVISGVARRCAPSGKKLIVICGCAGDGWEEALENGVSAAYFSCDEPKPFDEVIKTCREDLYAAAKKAAEDFGRKIG